MKKVDEIKQAIIKKQQEIDKLLEQLNELEPQQKQNTSNDNRFNNEDKKQNSSNNNKEKNNKQQSSNQSQEQNVNNTEQQNENNQTGDQNNQENNKSTSQQTSDNKETKNIDQQPKSENNNQNQDQTNNQNSDSQKQQEIENNNEQSSEPKTEEIQTKEEKENSESPTEQNNNQTENTEQQQNKSLNEDQQENENSNVQNSESKTEESENQQNINNEETQNQEAKNSKKLNQIDNQQKLKDKNNKDKDKTKHQKDNKEEKEKNEQSAESEQKEKQTNDENQQNKNDQQLEFNQDFLDSINSLGNSNSFGGIINQDINIENQHIKNLIKVFINKRFKNKNTDLNTRSRSLTETNGFDKWDVKSIIKHIHTKELNKIPFDKIGYEYDKGKQENIPLSFYFDLSGSMTSYSNLLAIIAVELLKEDITVLVGFNETIEHQIKCLDKKITVEELENILDGERESNKSLKIKSVNQNLDDYLIKAKAEKCVVFTDFDAIDNVINLSHHCEMYWLNFKQNYYQSSIENYRGFIYDVQDKNDFAKAITQMNSYKHKTLCYLQKEKVKEKTRQGGVYSGS